MNKMSGHCLSSFFLAIELVPAFHAHLLERKINENTSNLFQLSRFGVTVYGLRFMILGL